MTGRERLGLHIIGVCFTIVLGIVGWFGDKPDQPPWGVFLMIGCMIWMLMAAVDLMSRWPRNYELQLLPSGIRLSSWGRTKELVEPEIVGGRWLGWSQQITLRAGSQKASISLLDHPQLRDRAAVIEHCSQFLSPEQTADFGQEWVRVYYQLITPPKENLARLAMIAGSFFLVGILLLVVFTEYVLWQYPGAEHPRGGSLRTFYWIFAAAPVMLGLPLAAIHYVGQWAKARQSATSNA